MERVQKILNTNVQGRFRITITDQTENRKYTEQATKAEEKGKCNRKNDH